MEQRQLDFNRGAKLAILRRVSEQNVLSSRMLLVLRAIDDRAQNQSAITLTLSQIGEYSGQSRETAKRGVADLVRNSLLIKTAVVNETGKQANQYQIVWPQLNAIGDGERFDLVKQPPRKTAETTPAESTQVVIPATGQSLVDPGHSDPSDGSQRPADPGHSDPSIYIAPLRINNPPTSLGSEPPADDRPADWSGVEGDLISLGIKAAGAAIRTAQGRGCQPADILRLIDHARSKPGAWGPGAIHDRVRVARPGENPATGWAVESDAWQRAQKQQQQAAQRDRAAQQAAQRRAQRAQRRESDERLEREFGPVLDELTPAAVLDFSRTHCPTLVRLLRREPERAQQGGTRLFLLAALKKQGDVECLK